MHREAVLLVHGLWFGGWSLSVLAGRLRRTGYQPRYFHYRSTVSGLGAHAGELGRQAEQLQASRVDYVGHSLGGLLILRMLASRSDLPPGRVVLLGSPLQGSRVARRAINLPGGKALFGQAADELTRGFPVGATGREIGMIAGRRAIGMGRLLGLPATAGDGTVTLDEANDPGLSDRIVLPVSHTGMLFSRAVADGVDNFLQSGHFSPS